ncbi:hypothetical protein QOZ80_9BG0708100 [Eleusine coracana subsp. coracana]|nr:hypothetical protein QOZ80_9BG0708100 [Eleusine coracana subsp. coracana]
MSNPTPPRSTAAMVLVVVITTTLLLLLTPPATAAAGTHRHVARRCDPRRDVRVNQTMGATQIDGTNVFDVVVTNAWRGPVCDVHLNCGYRFRPVRQVDPGMLVPVGPGDCLLIHGGAIGPGGNVSFSYFSYVEYTMDVVSATCAGPGRRP